MYVLAPFQAWQHEPSYLAARLVVAAFGVGAVAGSWWLGRVAYGRRAGLVAAAAVAVCSTHVAYSHVAVTDVPLTAAVAVSLALAVTGRLEWAGLAAGVATGFKYPGVLLAVPLAVVGFRQLRRLAVSLGLLVVGFAVDEPVRPRASAAGLGGRVACEPARARRLARVRARRLGSRRVRAPALERARPRAGDRRGRARDRALAPPPRGSRPRVVHPRLQPHAAAAPRALRPLRPAPRPAARRARRAPARARPADARAPRRAARLVDRGRPDAHAARHPHRRPRLDRAQSPPGSPGRGRLLDAAAPGAPGAAARSPGPRPPVGREPRRRTPAQAGDPVRRRHRRGRGPRARSRVPTTRARRPSCARSGASGSSTRSAPGTGWLARGFASIGCTLDGHETARSPRSGRRARPRGGQRLVRRTREGARLPQQGELGEAREPDPGAGLLPGLAAGSARRHDRQPLEQHQLRQPRPQLPRVVRLAGDGRRGGRRRAARQPAGLSGPDDDPDLHAGRHGGRQDPPLEGAVLRRPARDRAGARDRRDDVHGEPGRRPVARAARLAPRRAASTR